MPSNSPIVADRSAQYTLLTGATGLVGNYLLKDLLLLGHRVAVVVRASRKLSVEQRVESIIQRWERELGHALPRPVVFEGDVNSEQLGLSGEQLEWIEDHCDRIIHNAAVLQFHGEDMNEEPWRTNLGGTRKAIDLATRCRIPHMHYVSTAYVCGVRDEVVREEDLDCGQAFRNAYEESKFRSEMLVREADGFESTTIYRPAVIVGDSKTGYTSTYHGLFMYLRLLATLVPAQEKDENGKFITPITVPISGDEPRNLVPVDWVSEVIAHLFSTPEAHGRTYHLVPDVTSSARELIGACCAYFNSDGVVFGGDDRSTDNEFATTFFDNARIYQSYEDSDPNFDNQNLKEFAGHLPCPPIDQEMVFRFMDFGIADQWGKKRAKAPEVSHWLRDSLEVIADRVRQSCLGELNGQPISIGLDVSGPGGGQWQLIASQASVEFRPGLPVSDSPVLSFDMSEVAAYLSPEHAEFSDFWADKVRGVLSSEVAG